MQGRNFSFIFVILVLAFTIFFLLNKEDTNIPVKTLTQIAKVPSKPINQSTTSISSINKPQTIVLENSNIPNFVEEKREIDFLGCVPDIVFDEEKKQQNIEEYFKSLSNSSAQKDLFYHALFVKLEKEQNRLDLIFDYINRFSADPFIAKNAINLCTFTKDSRCTKEFVNNSAMFDKENSAIWLSAASYYANRGDDEGVLDSIIKLIQAPIFNERYGESAAIYALALESSSENNFSQNAMLGLATSSILPSFGPITEWCKNNASDIEKSEACLALGQNIENRSKTMITHAIGLALQEIIFKSQNNNDLILELNQKRKILDTRDNQEAYFKTHIMLMLDERLTRSWLNNLDSIGEFETQKRAVKESNELYQQNENYLCSMINDAISNF